VPQRLLLINALRMRPDRVVVGEVRGGEAIDMLQAMNTGHDGSITTLHANTPRDALGRLETMISMANLNLPEKAMRQQIASAIDVVIQASRLSDGKRKVMAISEIVGHGGRHDHHAGHLRLRPPGHRGGRGGDRPFRATGIRPKFADRLQGVRDPAFRLAVHRAPSAGGAGMVAAEGWLLALLVFVAVALAPWRWRWWWSGGPRAAAAGSRSSWSGWRPRGSRASRPAPVLFPRRRRRSRR
jgi:hypothetical protein